MSSQSAEQVTPTDGTRMAAKSLTARADAWRPWRAYATLHLWRDAMQTGAIGRDTAHAAVPSGKTAARKKRARRDPATTSMST